MRLLGGLSVSCIICASVSTAAFRVDCRALQATCKASSRRRSYSSRKAGSANILVTVSRSTFAILAASLFDGATSSASRTRTCFAVMCRRLPLQPVPASICASNRLHGTRVPCRGFSDTMHADTHSLRLSLLPLHPQGGLLRVLSRLFASFHVLLLYFARRKRICKYDSQTFVRAVLRACKGLWSRFVFFMWNLSSLHLQTLKSSKKGDSGAFVAKRHKKPQEKRPFRSASHPEQVFAAQLRHRLHWQACLGADFLHAATLAVAQAENLQVPLADVAGLKVFECPSDTEHNSQFFTVQGVQQGHSFHLRQANHPPRCLV